MAGPIILSNRLARMQQSMKNFGDTYEEIGQQQRKQKLEDEDRVAQAKTRGLQDTALQQNITLGDFQNREAQQKEQDASALRSDQNELDTLDAGLTPFGPRLPKDETPTPFVDQNRNLRARLMARIETKQTGKPITADEYLARKESQQAAAQFDRKKDEADLESTQAGTKAKLMDAKKSAMEIKKAQAEIERLTKGGLDPEKASQIEGNLRNTFEAQTKPFVVVRDAFNRVQAVKDSPAGDVALIYGFMKINDPTAAVMEGDIANAKNAAGVPERVRTMYNNALSGRSLDPKTRADFVSQAESLYNAQKKVYDSTKASIQSLATRYGVDPERSTFDLTGGVTSNPPQSPAAGGMPKVASDADFDKLAPGTVFLDPNGVKRRKP
jgi:hypothetical protein